MTRKVIECVRNQNIYVNENSTCFSASTRSKYTFFRDHLFLFAPSPWLPASNKGVVIFLSEWPVFANISISLFFFFGWNAIPHLLFLWDAMFLSFVFPPPIPSASASHTVHIYTYKYFISSPDFFLVLIVCLCKKLRGFRLF